MNSLFGNEEVEAFTREKLFAVKIGIIGLVIFAGGAFVGWVVYTMPEIIKFMDVLVN